LRMARALPGENGKGRGKRRLLVWRAIFVLLLGLNLTLVCQGHLHDGHYSDAHITLFGEPEDESGAPVISTVQDPKGFTGIVPAPGSQEIPDLAGLGLVLFMLRVRISLFRESGFGGSLPCKSQVSLQPQAPPPRRRITPILLTV
jgi:hypothetical protein